MRRNKKKKKNYVKLIFFLLVFLISASEAQVKIALWGDSRENKDGACENIARILLNDITDWDFQIHTGDFTSHGTEADWQRTLNYAGIDSLFVPGKFFMCTSNHDDVQSIYAKYTAGILPTNSVDGTTHFYHYQRGNVHVIACDAYFTAATTMNNWLDTTLAKIPEDDWLIGVWHNPCYGDITYKDDYLDKCSVWLEKLQRQGADFIFHGHAHVYIRSHPLLADGTVNHDSGMIHIVNGCGGASWKAPQEYVDKTAYTPNETSFACITFITLDEDTAFIQTVDARPGKNLEVFDEFRWNKSARSNQHE